MAGYSIEILNTIRNNASYEYRQRIPDATAQNFSTIGYALMEYTVLKNEFCEALINKIGKTILEQKMFKNKLGKFKSGAILSQQDVEEIFIEMAKAEGSYDKDGKNPLGRRNPPEVKVAYHRQNRQDYYAVSIGDIDFIRVFRSPSTFDQFMTGLINSVYSADEYDEWIAMKNLIADYGMNDNFYEYPITPHPGVEDVPNLPGWSKLFVKAVRKAVLDLTFPSTLYNKAGVMTWAKRSDLVLLIHKDILVETDVELLSTAFNKDKTDLEVAPEIVVMDDFGELPNTFAILMDKEMFKVFDTLSTMEPQRNSQGLFTNYFYHHHQILSLSPFKNGAIFRVSNAGDK